jgi:hypothetical protein
VDLAIATPGHCPVDITDLRRRFRSGRYLIKSHAVQHAVKEGFGREHMVEAVLNGKVVEEYPDDRRTLVCGSIRLVAGVQLYLHVVCEYADPAYVEFVTAYIPDETQWETPPFRRRRRKTR